MHLSKSITSFTDTWNFGAANWKLVFRKLALADWRMMDPMDVNEAVLWFNIRLVAIMSIAIPKSPRTERLSSHPWINEKCLNLV